jgi:hypothetical protein
MAAERQRQRAGEHDEQLQHASIFAPAKRKSNAAGSGEGQVSDFLQLRSHQR